ncbi:MAG: putative DNA binding domain-containing protein [Opitutae bacterium]|nr:putative DNA binding domain-containing protein [Opitutae bacterium]
MSESSLQETIRSLTALPRETEWIEFKENDAREDEIGEYISALANAAALLEKDAAFLVWGIEDATHRVVGTSFDPKQAKVGNEELENWLHRQLHPAVDFVFDEGVVDERRVVLLTIQPCRHSPVRFRETEFVRIGTYKKKLKEYPEKERALWAKLSAKCFEEGIAASGVSDDEVLTLIDYPSFFELMQAPLPANKAAILERLAADELVVAKTGGRYDVTNLGGVLFAKELRAFGRLARKAIRVVQYKGHDRRETVREREGTLGYAAGFRRLLRYINDSLPENEIIGEALRQSVKLYPELAIRELAANALIHQDFSMSGTGPMIELFSDRLEISNPGRPLIDPLRFIDHSPRSRNEKLADLMRRVRICEERGSGFDKIVAQVEAFQLPAPDISVDDTHTRVWLFAARPFSEMDRADRIRACYQHCCLQWVSRQVMTNSSLRSRFKIEEEDYAVASRIIRDAIDAGLVKPEDPENRSRKHAKYIPFWG